MKELFNDILNIEDVMGVILLSHEGQLGFKHFSSPLDEDPDTIDWGSFLTAFNGIREADFFFENCRLYIRSTSYGYIMILMGIFTPIAMVRLNCDILLPSLKQATKSKGLGRFFKRKK